MKTLGRIAVVIVALVAMLATAAFFLRPKPIAAAVIRDAVVRTPALLERAWQLPAARAYRSGLLWQSNGSTCGPASLANAFRSLGEAATSEGAVLAGTGRCPTGICFAGLTLDEVAGVARKHTRRAVTVLRELTPERFRAELRRSNDPRMRYLVNFTRTAIFGGGGGHHSPIGGYLEAEDLVFVLDVNRTFGPWLIARDKLFSAVDTRDGDAKRGLLRIEAR